jgi:uncharacterized protein YndB with AHSA1/START domain
MIRKSVWIARPPAEAFGLFTGRISDWWPENRRHIGGPASSLSLSAEGGFWERAADGRQVELGRVRTWDPPRRLVLDFYVGSDPDHPTELEVLFEPEEGGTRVHVLHRAGPLGAEPWARKAALFEQSWDVVLAALASAR